MSAFSYRSLIFVFATCLLFTLCSAAEEVLLEERSEFVTRQYSKEVKHMSDKLHGIIMGLTVIVIFPLGAMSGKLFNRTFSQRSLFWAHICCQTLGLAMLITGFGLGVWVATLHNEVYASDPMGHTFLGTVIVGLFLIQPLIGIWHHRLYKLSKSNNYLRLGHIWFGRILMLLAIVNGGTGIVYGNNTPGGLKVYEALAALVGSMYLGLVVMWYFKERHGGVEKDHSSGSEVESGSRREKQQA